jgi:hypothetical protein
MFDRGRTVQAIFEPVGSMFYRGSPRSTSTIAAPRAMCTHLVSRVIALSCILIHLVEETCSMNGQVPVFCAGRSPGLPSLIATQLQTSTLSSRHTAPYAKQQSALSGARRCQDRPATGRVWPATRNGPGSRRVIPRRAAAAARDRTALTCPRPSSICSRRTRGRRDSGVHFSPST